MVYQPEAERVCQPEAEKPTRCLYVKVTEVWLVTEDHRMSVCTRNIQNEKKTKTEEYALKCI